MGSGRQAFVAPTARRLDRQRLAGDSSRRRAVPLQPGQNSRSTTCQQIDKRTRVYFVRITLDIPEPLIEEARLLLGFKSNSDTVVFSLQELIRYKRIDELKAMMGNVKLEIDLPKSRRRSRS